MFKRNWVYYCADYDKGHDGRSLKLIISIYEPNVALWYLSVFVFHRSSFRTSVIPSESFSGFNELSLVTGPVPQCEADVSGRPTQKGPPYLLSSRPLPFFCLAPLASGISFP